MRDTQTYPPRYWLTRLYVSLSVLATVAITFFAPTSLAYQVIKSTGPVGWVCTGVLGFLSALAVVDVIVNDLMPAPWALRQPQRHRHLMYMALAMGLVSTTFVIAQQVGWTVLMLNYWLDAAMAATLAFVDLFARHRGGRQA